MNRNLKTVPMPNSSAPSRDQMEIAGLKAQLEEIKLQMNRSNVLLNLYKCFPNITTFSSDLYKNPHIIESLVVYTMHGVEAFNKYKVDNKL